MYLIVFSHRWNFVILIPQPACQWSCWGQSQSTVTKFGSLASPRCFSTPRMVAWQHSAASLVWHEFGQLVSCFCAALPWCPARWKELEKSSGVAKATRRAKGRCHWQCSAMDDLLFGSIPCGHLHYCSLFSQVGIGGCPFSDLFFHCWLVAWHLLPV